MNNFIVLNSENANKLVKLFVYLYEYCSYVIQFNGFPFQLKVSPFFIQFISFFSSIFLFTLKTHIASSNCRQFKEYKHARYNERLLKRIHTHTCILTNIYSNLHTHAHHTLTHTHTRTTFMACSDFCSF